MIAIIDYDVGRESSLADALKITAADFKVTSNEYEIIKADKIILPDEMDAAAVIKQLHKCNLFTMLRVCKKPVLGIGLGLQIMADQLKKENAAGLGIFHSSTDEFDTKISSASFTGVNEIEIQKASKLFEEFRLRERFYFNNRYYLPVVENTTSTARNGIAFSASVESGNFYGVQFLPEKSGETGIRLLKNFLVL